MSIIVALKYSADPRRHALSGDAGSKARQVGRAPFCMADEFVALTLDRLGIAARPHRH